VERIIFLVTIHHFSYMRQASYIWITAIAPAKFDKHHAGYFFKKW
jgi:hypothetical protein